MLVTFQTDSHESISFFEEGALQLLDMMGESGRIPGALLASDVPHALLLLRKAIAGQKKRPHQAGAEADPDLDLGPEISLANRAYPLIVLLQAAENQHCDVMWGMDGQI